MNNKLLAKKLLAFILITYHLSFITIKAQRSKIDSLLAVLKTEKEDTNEVNTLGNLAYRMYASNPDSTIKLGQQELNLSERLGWKKGEVGGYDNIGIGYLIKANYTQAEEYFLKGLKGAESIKDKQLQAIFLGNLGLIYNDQGNYPKALEYYTKALNIAEEMGNQHLQMTNLTYIGQIYSAQSNYVKALDYFLKALKMTGGKDTKQTHAAILTNIALIYYDQKDYSKALDYYYKALHMTEETGDKRIQASILIDLGVLYNEEHDTAKSMEYSFKALKLTEVLGDKNSEANMLAVIGSNFESVGNHSQALAYEQKALKLCTENGIKDIQANALANIGSIYTHTGRFKEAELYLKNALSLDDSLGQQDDVKEIEESLSRLYDTSGRYKLALDWYKKAMVLKDTLFNIDKNKALTSKELNYQFEQKEEAAKAEQDRKDVMVAADKKKQQIILGFVCGGLILVLASLGLLFSRFRVIQKQKRIIEKQKTEVERQKSLVEEKNKDITDSITYAKRLQSAILPAMSQVKQYFPESFILYKPKDIVAGDFYWMQKVSKMDGKGDIVLIAAADCTGHGVPGAMVSVVCSNAINRIVKETEVRDTGSVLDNVRRIVLETFAQSNDNVQDGMDISLCAINMQTNILEWTGANNPLWYIHKGKLIEIAPDKQSVGKQDNAKPFTTHLVNIEKGDAIYLFTDGYADQFGGPKGKKFKYKQLQQLLIDNAQLVMEEQRKVMEQTLENWMGKLEQVDDILMIGIRV